MNKARIYYHDIGDYRSRVEERTIERYLESHEQELKHNGYFLCRGKLLKESNI
jgi:hypothetical protein